MTNDIKEYEDRFEARIKVYGRDVSVVIDKPVTSDLCVFIFKEIVDNVEQIWERSIRYFHAVKEEYGISYIDDLSDPQIIANTESISLYWWSDKGEENGEPVIGINFTPGNFEPMGLTIGD